MVKIHGNDTIAERPIQSVSANWATFLQEHADYERKFSAYTLSIIGKYPDKLYAIAPLVQMAVGSLGIFNDLYTLMEAHAVQLIPESPQNLYLKQINWLCRPGREDRLLDKLLLGAIAETRSATRFKQVGADIESPQLMAFYNTCARLKQDYADRYMELAYQTAADDVVNARMEELKAEEEKMFAGLRGAAGVF